MDTFGMRLKAIRQERGMSQQDLAKILGTSKQVISRYETNQRTPKITVANEYAEKLGVELNYLLGEEKPVLEDELSDKDKIMSDLFKKLDEADRDIVIALASQLRQKQDQ